MEYFKCSECEKIFMSEESSKTGCQTCSSLEKIVPNSSGASEAKHMPSIKIEGDQVIVSIGEELHPMKEEHLITWVAAEYQDAYIRYALHADEEPIVTFDYEEGMTIYSYCNVHGLFSKKI